MNATTIALSLAAIALLFIVAPFLRGKRGGAGDALARRGAGPVASALPDPLDELELDRAMGKVAEEDYQRLRRGIERERAEVTARAAIIVPAGATGDGGAVAGAGDVAAQAEAMIRAARTEVVACAACGARPEPAARFCSNCGKAVAA